MKNIFENVYKKLVTVFGNVKYFKYPLFLVYDPSDYEITGNEFDFFCKTIIKGDIVLRAYDHYLCGSVIPGFYSHASIVVEDGLLIHSVSNGICEISAFDFAKCDGLAIVRPMISSEDKKNAVIYANSNVGKEYDFWFDFSDESCFSCTELVYWAYKNKLGIEPQSLKKMFGLIKQKIISPDDFLNCSGCKLIWESSYGKIKRLKKKGE